MTAATVKAVPAVDLGRKYLDMAYQYAADVRDERSLPVRGES